jgi:hypothetical protein
MMNILDDGSIVQFILWNEINSDDAKKAVMEIAYAAQQHSRYADDKLQKNESRVSQMLRQACK